MTARLRGSAQYEKAAVRLAVHIIGGLMTSEVEGGIRHEDEEELRSYGQMKSPGYYPASLTSK